MWERLFNLRQHETTVRTELLAGVTTFLTMAYIIFVQPAVLSGALWPDRPATGMDFGAVTTATCLSAALASLIMGLYGRYPIAQAPGMGENFFFVLSTIPAADAMLAASAGKTAAASAPAGWQVALGVVFISGVIFLLLSLAGVRGAILDSISPSLRNGIAVGIGLFIAFLGLQGAGVIVANPGTLVQLNPHFNSPDLIVFFVGLTTTAGLHALRVRGSIVWGIAAGLALALALHFAVPHLPAALADSPTLNESKLVKQFRVVGAGDFVAAPPSIQPTLLKMDLRRAASWPMLPFILIFLFMLMFDTVGTLVGVAEQAGLMKDGTLPRARQAFASDALGTVAGAALGTSTVTSFIESAAGVEQGGRTGLTAVTVAALFLVAPFFSPVIAMVGSYAPITAPALVVVGSMMIRNVTKIQWDNYAESLPAFLIVLGIPLTCSIADGLALGFITYPVVKLLAGQARDVKWLTWLLAVVLVAYFVLVRVAV